MGTIVGIHSLWRWVVLLVVLVALVRGLIGWLRGGEWSSLDRQLTMLATTTIDIQFLLGLILWIGTQAWTRGTFLAVTHPLVMLAALVVAHAGNILLRRAPTSTAKYRALTLSLIVVIFLVTAAIPPASWSRIWA